MVVMCADDDVLVFQNRVVPRDDDDHVLVGITAPFKSLEPAFLKIGLDTDFLELTDNIGRRLGRIFAASLATAQGVARQGIHMTGQTFLLCLGKNAATKQEQQGCKDYSVGFHNIKTIKMIISFNYELHELYEYSRRI